MLPQKLHGFPFNWHDEYPDKVTSNAVACGVAQRVSTCLPSRCKGHQIQVWCMVLEKTSRLITLLRSKPRIRRYSPGVPLGHLTLRPRQQSLTGWTCTHGGSSSAPLWHSAESPSACRTQYASLLSAIRNPAVLRASPLQACRQRLRGGAAATARGTPGATPPADPALVSGYPTAAE